MKMTTTITMTMMTVKKSTTRSADARDRAPLRKHRQQRLCACDSNAGLCRQQW
jgi:hypothetical protein